MRAERPLVGRSAFGWVVLFGLGLVGCAATVDRSAQQAQLSSFLARCETLEQAGQLTTVEAAMTCWLTPTRAMMARDGSPPLPVFDAYAEEVLTLARLQDQGHLNAAGFLEGYRQASLRFARASEVHDQGQASPTTASGWSVATGVILGLLTSNPPSHPQQIYLNSPPPAPAIPPAIDFRPR